MANFIGKNKPEKPMKNNALRAIAMTLIILDMVGSASAQVYRCGSKYQDYPCESGTQAKVATSSSAPQPAEKLSQDPVCTPRGARALQIMWARQAGATAERQLAETRMSDERKLILDVYQKHGTANEVRAAIEADCMAEKERLAQAAALAAAAARLSGQSQPAQAVPRGPSDEEMNAAQSRRKEEEATLQANKKKAQCKQYDAQIEKILDRQRAGLSAQGMENLNQQRRDIEKEKHDSGC